MARSRNMPGGTVKRRVLPGTHVVTLSRQLYKEVFVTAVPIDGEDAESVLTRIAGALGDSRTRVVSLEVFGFPSGGTDCMQVLSRVFGCISWPVTWIEQECEQGYGVGGAQAWAVVGVPVEPLELEGRLVGCVFEDDHAQYCRLGNLLPADPSRSRNKQARQVLEQMETALRAAGMEFSHVLRTWFYNDDILSWYGDFNRVRDAFFRERRLLDGLVPASTGVGVHHSAATGTTLVSGLLAVKAKHEAVRAVAVPSPLQGPAPEYGSSFSRAVELVTPDHRRLFVSGTASIAPEGHTVHVGDAEGQMALTMEVVHAILESRGMDWTDVLRAVAHLKQAENAPAFHRCCADNQAPTMPVVLAQSELCRDDLLFELEIDAATAG